MANYHKGAVFMLAEKLYKNFKVIRVLAEFKAKSNVIVTNRKVPELDFVKEKIYTRDLFGSD